MKKVIDISGINNCWMVYIKPGGKEGDFTYIENLQEKCKQKSLFGLGWLDGKIASKYRGKKLDAESIEEYVEECSFKDKENLKNNLKKLANMKENDLLMTRLSDGKYYIGRVSHNSKYFYEKDEELGWVCEVEKWCEFSEKKLPGDIIGRFSQRKHTTIQRVANERIRLLIIKLFSEKEEGESKIQIPKISLNEKNFSSALNYMELEDLVYLYMQKENPDYFLLPPQCKISKVKYEFELIHKKDNKRITCQVKNKDKVDYKNYLEDAKDNFEKIYLFSGIEKYDDNENKEKVKSEIEERGLENRLIIIEKKELYKFFKETGISIIGKEISQYYEFKTNEVEKPSKWKQVERFNRKEKNTYKEDDNYIFFNCCDTLHYNKEFNGMIKTKEKKEWVKRENEIIKQWLK